MPGRLTPRFAALLATAVLILTAISAATTSSAHPASPRVSVAVGVDDEIHSSFGDDGTQMWLYWRGPDVMVSYGATGSYGVSAMASAPAIHPADNAGPFQQVKLTGLLPNTTYHYRVGPTGNDNTFRTSPTGDITWDDVGDTGTT